MVVSGCAGGIELNENVEDDVGTVRVVEQLSPSVAIGMNVVSQAV